MTASATRPFSNRSLWNAHALTKTFGTVQVPPSYYSPVIGAGDLSPAWYVVDANTPLRRVYGPSYNNDGILDVDRGAFVEYVTVRIPAGITAPAGGDGHVAIINPIENRIDDFYQMRPVNGELHSTIYTWTALDGTGLPDPAHYYQGSRATGINTRAGIITAAEFASSATIYEHALAMSGAVETCAANPAYKYPATMADGYAAGNTGPFPEGTILGLKPNFDFGPITHPELQRICRTLQKYHAILADGNSGCPYIFYAEYGTPNYPSLDSSIASQMDHIRQGLYEITSMTNWRDSDGIAFTPPAPESMNVLSMRGPYGVVNGASQKGEFNSYTQRLEFPGNTGVIQQVNGSSQFIAYGSIPGQQINWAAPQPGDTYQFRVYATGGALLRLQWPQLTDTGLQGNGFTQNIVMPANPNYCYMIAQSGNDGGGTVYGTLTKLAISPTPAPTPVPTLPPILPFDPGQRARRRRGPRWI